MRVDLVLQCQQFVAVALAFGTVVRAQVIDGGHEGYEAAHCIVKQHFQRMERPPFVEFHPQIRVEEEPNQIV